MLADILHTRVADYVFAVLWVIAAALLRLGLQHATDTLPPFITFYPAVMLAGLLGGLGPGLVATGTSALLTAWWVFPEEPYHGPHEHDLISIGFFCAMGAFTSIVTHSYRRARQRAAKAENELGAKEGLARAAEQTEQQRQLLAVTLASIGDAVIVADIQTRVTFLNGEAARLTGWTAEEATGQPLCAVFRVVNEHTRQPVDNPAEKVLRIGTVVGLANHSLLLARDGREIPIDDSAAPVRQADGVVHGVVLVFRDCTWRRRAAEELHASRQMLREVLDTVPVRVFWKDLNSVYLGCNRPFARDAGLMSPEQIVGQDDLSLGWREQAEMYRADDRQVMQTGQPKLNYEEPQTAPDGQRLWLRTSKVPLRGEHGRIIGVLGTYEDISDRKRAEEALQLNEARLQVLLQLNQMSDASLGDIARFAMEQGVRLTRSELGYIAFANEDESVLTMFAWSKQAMHECAVADRPLEYPVVTTGLWGEAVRQRRPIVTNDYAAPNPFKKGLPDGHVDLRRHMNVPIFDDGKIVIVAGVGNKASDYDESDVRQLTLLMSGMWQIVRRKRDEEALRESESRFRALSTASFEGIALDEGGKLIDANEQFLKMLGYSRDELVGMDVTTLLPEEDDHARREAVSAASAQAPVECSLVRKDGQRLIVELRTTTFDYQNRRVRFATIRDITERKRAEEQLADAKRSAERAKALAENASRAKDQFLAVLSHELRTPLTPVLATISMLLKTGPVDDLRENLDIVLRNVELEARLIDDLLDVTRIARGKLELHRQPVVLSEIIRRSVEVCLADIEARRLEFGMNFGEAADYLVEADGARLQQVFWNLLKNAIKFTPQGGCVGIRCRRENGNVVTEVSDSGIGIEPDLLPRLFNAFEQAERSITRQFGGLGLGLAISKGLVEMHGGTITANSAGKGRGATFTVTLPIHAEPAPPPGSRPLPPAHEAGHPSGLRILLVEDHGDTARVIAKLLKAAGHDVITAGAVATALQEAERGDFDLLVSDLGLPDGSGLDLMRELRARGKTFPGIAMTGYGQEEDIRRTREAGFHTHLTKPIDVDQLGRALDEFKSIA